MRRLAPFWFLICLAAGLRAAEQLPPPPGRYFNDYAHVVPGDVALRLNQKLEDFEKATSSQIVVAVFDKLPPNAALEDFTVRTARSWRVGGKAKANGAVLFVFVQDHKMRVEVGYGLEGTLTDLHTKLIIENDMVPAFRAGLPGSSRPAPMSSRPGILRVMEDLAGEWRRLDEHTEGHLARSNRWPIKIWPAYG